METNQVVVLTPIYRSTLTDNETAALKHSYAVLASRDLVFACSRNLDVSFYREQFPRGTYVYFDDSYFASTKSYSTLLTSSCFYESFADYSHVLIVQQDCLIFRDDLDYWMASRFDYVGAPWPNTWIFTFPSIGSPFDGMSFHIAVGNGGLSLRKVASFIAALKEFNWLLAAYQEVVEDAFFSLVGHISCEFRVPNTANASCFSIECEPRKYFRMSGKLPMGTHAWERWDKAFWLETFALHGIAGFK